ncbi:hypothetical protein GCM10025868_35680 [Angustibacter aerolatus]|uniref:Uncharacterized protein n=1 Tax=Angustibacter aerolatus TaxID=1162965 RepID=A0ABQ6JJD9_9ACTN|nr:hypothetical protein GCM10025868_35680 [Angustibacter aerolatus]
MRDTPSTCTCPDGVSATPDSSSPIPAVLGTEPTAITACEPSTRRPSVSLDDHAVAGAGDGGRARAVQHGHAAAAEHVLDHLGGVGVLAGQHAVAGADQGDGAAEAEVGVRELGAGDAGADDHDVLGQVGQVVEPAAR